MTKTARISLMLGIYIVLAMQPSCTDSRMIQDPYGSAIVVQIFLAGGTTPDPGKEIQVLSTGERKVTNESGIARFLVPAGQNIVRVFGLNHGGPAYQSEDHVVEVQTGEQRWLTLFDCPLCD
jgi:hypothetical protein